MLATLFKCTSKFFDERSATTITAAASVRRNVIQDIKKERERGRVDWDKNRSELRLSCRCLYYKIMERDEARVITTLIIIKRNM